MSFLDKIISPLSSLAGGFLDRRSQESNFNKNADLQREFAKNGIRWRVQDAKAAGLHPLAALGMSGASAAPIGISSSMGESLRSAGQDISRAIDATRTSAERAESNAIAIGTARAQQRNIELNNALLEQKINSQTQVGPGMPSGVQSFPVLPDSMVTRDLVDIKPAEVVSARSGDPATMAGPAGPTFREYDMGVMGKWKLPEGQFFEDSEILKAVVATIANQEKFGRLNNIPARLVWEWMQRPEWVDRIARSEGHRTMIPFYRRDGKRYWKPAF